MTFKAVFLCAVIAGASTLAISCTTPAQMSQTENTKPIKTVAIPAAEDFTTAGKPTQTIETPWGPREIYDPAQDEEVRAAYMISLTKEKNFESLQLLNIASRIAGLDFARLGCVDIWMQNLDNFQEVFNEDCGLKHAFGSSTLTDCELENLMLAKAAPQIGNLHDASGTPLTSVSDENENFKNSFTYTCRKWRNEMSDGYKACLIQQSGTIPLGRNSQCFEKLKG